MFYFKKILKSIMFVIITVIDYFIFKKNDNCPDKTNNILLVKIDGIGDYVLFRNFIEIIKNSDKFRGCSITLCANEICKDLAVHFDNDFIDDFIWIDPLKFALNLKYRRSVANDISSKTFDFAIQPTLARQSLIGDSIVKFSNATNKIGNIGDLNNMSSFEKYFTDKYFDELIDTGKETEFEFQKNIKFFSKLTDSTIELSKPNINIKAENIYDEYILFTPGAGAKYREWSADNYHSLALKLYMKHKIIITGSIKDISLGNQIINDVPDAVNLTGKSSLIDLLSLIKNCKLLISGDTGAVHIAAALGKKFICISNGNSYKKFAPYPKEIFSDCRYIFPPLIERMLEQGREDEVIIKYKYFSNLNINEISVERVLIAIKDLLGDNNA